MPKIQRIKSLAVSEGILNSIAVSEGILNSIKVGDKVRFRSGIIGTVNRIVDFRELSFPQYLEDEVILLNCDDTLYHGVQAFDRNNGKIRTDLSDNTCENWRIEFKCGSERSRSFYYDRDTEEIDELFTIVEVLPQ